MGGHGGLQDEDSALLLRARSDGEAFGRFYTRNRDPLAAHLYRLTLSSEVAADLLHESFAKALMHLERFDPRKGNGRMWLYGIARHEYLAWVRHGETERRARQRLGLRAAPPPDDALAYIEGLVDAAEVSAALRAALGSLSPVDREIIEHRVLEHRSYEEIAALVGCTPAAARVRLSRALARLKRHWDERFDPALEAAADGGLVR